jgi:preprotein translocase subunit SecG
MANVLIVAYLLIVLALIGVILLQRSEGGALGIGGGGGGLMTARGSANLLTRTTAILAVLFFATAIALSILSGADRGSQGILDAAGEQGAGASSVLEALDSLQGDDADVSVPDLPATEDVPAADTPAPDTDSPDLAVPDTGGGNAGN